VDLNSRQFYNDLRLTEGKQKFLLKGGLLVVVRTPYFYAFLAAVLFGISVPISKYLLDGIGPLFLASLLYLGSAFFLFGFNWKRFLGDIYALAPGSPDFFRLVLSVVAGGIIAPAAMLAGLRMSHPATVSLMLNMELPFTVLIAWLIFHEHIGKRSFAAFACIALSTFALFADQPQFSRGVLYITLAAFMWGFDNNLSARIEGLAPSTIAIMKGICGGGVNFILAAMMEPLEPSVNGLIGGLLVGFICYGISLVLYIRAARLLGAARGFMVFAFSPFIGAIASYIFFQEEPGLFFWNAFLGMVIGVMLLIYEKHSHWHVHESVTHTHEHTHDDVHCGHEHPEYPKSLKHTHPHKHSDQEHSHPHYPDTHHRHRH
jgi:drug/metabolite transporter (DMT)-like permease